MKLFKKHCKNCGDPMTVRSDFVKYCGAVCEFASKRAEI